MAATMIHKFEEAGLGKAPFQFEGFKENWFVIPGVMKKPGSSCDYCGTCMVGEYWIVSSDGRRFKVGSECIRKVGDAGLKQAVSEIEREKRRAAAERREEKLRAERAEFRARFNADTEMQAALRALPHPAAWAARKGMTRLDYVLFMTANSGNRNAVKFWKALYGSPLQEQVDAEARRAADEEEARCDSLWAAKHEENYR